jgi:tetratricopeptide (TPR) repeat protein
MRLILIGLALALVAPAAMAQTQQQRDWCDPSATDDQRIDGCTAVIRSGRETPANQVIAYTNRGRAYDDKGLYDQAIADATRVIALKPDNAVAYNNRGNAYANKGLYDQAIADYTQAIALKSDDAIAYQNRGIAYEDKGSRDQAIADYRAALRLDPTRQKAKDGLTRLGVTP